MIGLINIIKTNTCPKKLTHKIVNYLFPQTNKTMNDDYGITERFYNDVYNFFQRLYFGCKTTFLDHFLETSKNKAVITMLCYQL